MLKDTKESNIIRILMLIYMVPLGLVLAFNTLISMLQTTYSELYQQAEIPLYKKDHPILLLLIGVAFFVGLFLLGRFLDKKKAEEYEKLLRIKYIAECLSILFAALVSLSCVFLFKCILACDSMLISDAAKEFLAGDYSSLTGDGYLSHYPFQLGFVGYIQLFYIIFGYDCYRVLQIVNAIMIVLTVFLFHRITDTIFNDPVYSIVFSICSVALLPYYMYAIFVYGDVPGIFLGVAGIYFAIKYMATSTSKSLNGKSICMVLGATLSMTLAMILKGNSAIFLVAIVIALVIFAFSKHDWRPLIFIGILLVGCIGLSKLVYLGYSVKTGMEIPDGVPKTAWVAMGLQSDEEIGFGAYNGYNWNVYTENGYDSELASQVAIDSIKESLRSYIASPKEGVRFFYYKFIAMWNMPDYNALLDNEWYSRHVEGHSPLAVSLIYGTGRILLGIMTNVLQFLVLLGATILVVSNVLSLGRKRRYDINADISSRMELGYLGTMPVLLTVLGGYIFHIFWEAQSRYALPYYVLCVIVAAWGWISLVKHLSGTQEV